MQIGIPDQQYAPAHQQIETTTLKITIDNLIITDRHITIIAPITGAATQPGAVIPLPESLLHPETEAPTQHRAGAPIVQEEEDNKPNTKKQQP